MGRHTAYERAKRARIAPAGHGAYLGSMNPEAIRFSVAPMMDWTDRHCRAFHRGLSRRARLYT
jgi:hypothetical protein